MTEQSEKNKSIGLGIIIFGILITYPEILLYGAILIAIYYIVKSGALNNIQSSNNDDQIAYDQETSNKSIGNNDFVLIHENRRYKITEMK